MKAWTCDRCKTSNDTPRCSGCNGSPYLITGGKGWMMIGPPRPEPSRVWFKNPERRKERGL
jgi:hypothetical protein